MSLTSQMITSFVGMNGDLVSAGGGYSGGGCIRVEVETAQTQAAVQSERMLSLFTMTIILPHLVLNPKL